MLLTDFGGATLLAGPGVRSARRYMPQHNFQTIGAVLRF